MSTGQKRVWKVGDHWRTLAFQYFRDSRQWRYLLELNPEYDITTEPALGVEINITGPTGDASLAPASVESSTVGTLQQLDNALDLRSNSFDGNPVTLNPGIFPWDDVTQYTNRLSDYTASALLDANRTNGFGLDSPQAFRDSQRG